MPMTLADLSNMLPDMLPRLWAFAFRLSQNQYDAEELVQRACIRGLERVHQLMPDTSAQSWMFSIVHSTWLNEMRARRVRSRARLDWDDDLLQTVADPSASDPAAVLSMHQVIDAVQRLPETQRTVLILVAVEGFTYPEAAMILGVPIGTVISRLSRAPRTIGSSLRTQ